MFETSFNLLNISDVWLAYVVRCVVVNGRDLCLYIFCTLQRFLRHYIAVVVTYLIIVCVIAGSNNCIYNIFTRNKLN